MLTKNNMEWKPDELEFLVDSLVANLNLITDGGITAVLTGSFADYKIHHEKGEETPHHPNWLHPDINLYFFVEDASQRVNALEGLSQTIAFIQETMDVRNGGRPPVSLAVDTHPFTTPTYTPGYGDSGHRMVQVTTNVFTMDDLKNLTPDFIRAGWASCYYVLSGEDPLKEYVGMEIKRDGNWIYQKAVAMTNYLNVLKRLPLAITDTTSSAPILHQIYLYLWEIIKDGVGPALSDEEFESGMEATIRGDKKQLDNFYRERYGENAYKTVIRAIDISNNFLQYIKDPDATRELYPTLLNSAIELGETVSKKVGELVLKHSSSKTGAQEISKAVATPWVWY